METQVAFQKRQRDMTHWIVVEHGEGTTPEIIEALRSVGWQTEADEGFNSLPPLDGVQETKLTRKGTDLFGGWTEDEKRSNMAEARRIFRSFGYERVPVETLTMADLL